MENATYTTLTRQAGLMREMQVVANNIANAATTGFRAENMWCGSKTAPRSRWPAATSAPPRNCRAR